MENSAYVNEDVKIIAKSLLASSDFEINELIKEGALIEVKNE